MTSAQKGVVYLVGAGPGDPELLTVRALHLLQTADLVLHDDLVPDAVLALIHEGAAIESVGKRCGRARITQQGINAILIEEARKGLSVVRLKSGDPMVFGRAAEELDALRAAGIEAVVVPGVSAVFAAAATLQTPLTDRRTSSRLILATGSHAEGKEAPPLWQGTLNDEATLAVYMPGRDFAGTGAQLLANGMDASMPVVAVSRAGQPEQSIVTGRVGTMHTLHPGHAPVLLLIGRALEAIVSGQIAREAPSGQITIDQGLRPLLAELG
ncbi:uroporphyrinogen-III C-methyltransferase [Terriglobus tenax]|uniref:uroporphyrinogen-III C-methyltransferase n=1 Tax=Terriglobus tenax TaxID=1111115 RepID=UPI0021DF4DCB|nr:uroporphyrinogen-III C-methyltransferase [Terriglobus tenax]